MSAEDSTWSELTQFMSNHILSNEDRDELVSIVNRERMAHKFGGDGGPARVGFDHPLLAGAIHLEDPVQQFRIYVRAFLQ